MKFRPAAELKELGATTDEIAQEGKRVFAAMDLLMEAAKREHRNLNADERRQYDALEVIYDGIADLAEMKKVDRTGVVAPQDGAVPDYKAGHSLAASQTFAGAVRALNLDRDDRDGRSRGGLEPDEPLNLAQTLKNAMSGGVATAGGFALPTILTADLVDLARNTSRVLEAGARIVPMANRTVDVPKWDGDPLPQWRAEGAAIAEDDGLMGKLTLSAHTLAVAVRVSRELIEDTSLDEDLKAAFAAAFALKLDWAALYGTGLADVPLGVKSTPGVTVTPVAVNGAVPSWDNLIDSVGRLRDSNENPNAQILSDRTARTLGKVKDTNAAYLAPPAYLDGVSRLSTNQVPNNLTEGTAAGVTSDLFTADWGQLYVGVRTQLQITLLSERYMVDAGQYGFVAWWRGDVQVARPKAFDVLTGIKAA